MQVGGIQSQESNNEVTAQLDELLNVLLEYNNLYHTQFNFNSHKKTVYIYSAKTKSLSLNRSFSESCLKCILIWHVMSFGEFAIRAVTPWAVIEATDNSIWASSPRAVTIHSWNCQR